MGRRFSKIEENSFFLPETLLQNINFIKLSVHFMIGQYDISVSLPTGRKLGPGKKTLQKKNIYKIRTWDPFFRITENDSSK